MPKSVGCCKIKRLSEPGQKIFVIYELEKKAKAFTNGHHHLFIEVSGLCDLAEKGYSKSHDLELDLDDFSLETTTKHLKEIVINYQINSPRNIMDCLKMFKLKIHATWKVQCSSEELWSRHKNKIIRPVFRNDSTRMVAMASSGSKNLWIYESIYLFISESDWHGNKWGHYRCICVMV